MKWGEDSSGESLTGDVGEHFDGAGGIDASVEQDCYPVDFLLCLVRCHDDEYCR